MTRHEKLILLVVSLAVLSWFGAAGKEIAVASYYGAAPIPSPDRELLRYASLALISLTNIGAAIWLGIEASALALKSWVWVLFGLLFGMVGVAVFYVIQLYTRRAHET